MVGRTGPLALSLLLNDVPHRFVVASRDRASRAANAAPAVADPRHPARMTLRWSYWKRVVAGAIFGLYIAHLLYFLNPQVDVTPTRLAITAWAQSPV